MERHQIIEITFRWRVFRRKPARIPASFSSRIETAALHTAGHRRSVAGRDRRKAGAFNQIPGRHTSAAAGQGFDFSDTPINEGLVRDLATGSFLHNQRNAVLVGGTGTEET